MRRAQKTIGKFSRSIIGLAGAGGLILWTKRTLESADALAKTSQKLGIASEALAGLQHAAKLSGVETNVLNMGLQRMVRRVSEAAQGTGEAKDAIKELGLNAKLLAAQTPDQVFVRIAQSMKTVGNQSDRVRIAMKLFDTGGVALVNTLALGEAGLKAATREARMLGLTFSGQALKSIQATNDAFARLKASAQGIANTFVTKLAPSMKQAADVMSGIAISLRTGNTLLLSNIGNIARWTVGLGAATFIASKMVNVMQSMVIAYKAITKSSAIALAFTGPKGWAIIAAGAAAAAVTIKVVNSAFAEVAQNIRHASRMGREYNDTMTQVSATLNDTAVNQAKLNMQARMSLFDKVKKSAKSAEDAARSMTTRLGEMLANLSRTPAQAILAAIKRNTTDPRQLKLASDLADSIDKEMSKRFATKKPLIEKMLGVGFGAGRVGFKTAKEVAFGGRGAGIGSAIKRQVTLLEQIKDSTEKMARQGGVVLA